MELIPLFDRVVLKMTEAETTTKSAYIPMRVITETLPPNG